MSAVYILGLSCFAAESAAALTRDGHLIAEVREADFSHIAHDDAFPTAAIADCLRRASITTDQLDAVVFAQKPLLTFERLLIAMLADFPRSADLWRDIVFTWLPKKLWIKSLIESRLAQPTDRVLFCDQITAQAASAFYRSPYDEAAILIVDTVGERTTTALGHGQQQQIEWLAEQHFPHSLGLFAQTFAALLGTDMSGIAQLAAQGTARHVDILRQVIALQADGSIQLDRRFFSFPHAAGSRPSPLLIRMLDTVRASPRDLAASVQTVIGDGIVGMAQQLYAQTGSQRLCVGGALAENGAAIAQITVRTPFQAVFVPDYPGSAAAAGAALWASYALFGQSRSQTADPQMAEAG